MNMKDDNFFSSYKRGKILIEAKSQMPEKFLNLLWKNGVLIYKVNKIDINTIELIINLKYYSVVEAVAKKTLTKVKIKKRWGVSFIILKTKKRRTLVIGALLFFGVLYFLSSYIWGIDIKTDDKLTPYEIRTRLYSYGIKEGINKNDFNVYNIENSLQKDLGNLLWVKVRVEGAKLKVSAKGRNNPPVIVNENTPCDIVAKRDAQILRVYTSAGTAVVKGGDIVKKGQLLVKGEQGKEELKYFVHAAGDVIGKTYYEEEREVRVKGTKKVRTGNKITHVYLNIGNKKIYLKNNIIKYNSYDKIESGNKILKKETFYELKEVPLNLKAEDVSKKEGQLMLKDLEIKFDKSVKILDKKIENVINGDIMTVRAIIVAEEKIGEQQIIN